VKVCVYCASSTEAHPDYYAAASRLGAILAGQGITIVYGGGSVGAMGALADGALEAGGKLIGILPRFMDDLEWGHKSLTELRIADDIHQRKRWMIEDVDAVVALPGGCGTFEELLEAITWKRLGPRVLRPARGPARARGGGALHGRAAPRDVDGGGRPGRGPGRHPERARVVLRGPTLRPARELMADG
jgi:uncharacterized protein (TIGR00730 family)